MLLTEEQRRQRRAEYRRRRRQRRGNGDGDGSPSDGDDDNGDNRNRDNRRRRRRRRSRSRSPSIEITGRDVRESMRLNTQAIQTLSQIQQGIRNDQRERERQRERDKQEQMNRTREQELDKYLEKKRIELNLKFDFRYKIGERSLHTKLDKEINLIKWYEQLRPIVKKSRLLEKDQPLLVQLIVRNSVINDPYRRYVETTNIEGLFQYYDDFIDWIFNMIPITIEAVKYIYDQFMEARIKSDVKAHLMLQEYVLRYRRLIVCKEMVSQVIMKQYEVSPTVAAARAYNRLSSEWRKLVKEKLIRNGEFVLPNSLGMLHRLLIKIETEKDNNRLFIGNPMRRNRQRLDTGKRVNAIQNRRGNWRGSMNSNKPFGRNGFRNREYNNNRPRDRRFTTNTFNTNNNNNRNWNNNNNNRGNYANRRRFGKSRFGYRNMGNRNQFNNNRNQYGNNFRNQRQDKANYINRGRGRNRGNANRGTRGRRGNAPRGRGSSYSRGGNSSTRGRGNSNVPRRGRIPRGSKRGGRRGRQRGRRGNSRGRGRILATQKDSKTGYSRKQFNQNDCKECGMLGHFEKDCPDMGMDKKLEFEKKAHEQRERTYGSANAIIVGDTQRYINYITNSNNSNNNNNNNNHINTISNGNNSNISNSYNNSNNNNDNSNSNSFSSRDRGCNRCETRNSLVALARSTRPSASRPHRS